MSKLKELTWEHHKNAERQEFASLMMSGKLHPDLYATYLWNQHKKYDLLEAMCGAHGIFAELGQNISRKLFIEEDFRELWEHDNEPLMVQSTIDYLQHMRDIMHDRDAIMAHVYVLYMGDMSGGQMIKKKIPGEGRMYDFEGDIPAIKDKIRELTTDDMADEAKCVFDSATQLFQQLMELGLERTLEPSDTVSE
jgi:heme oxygenase